METVLKDRDAMVALYASYCEGYDQPELLDQALEKLATKTLLGSRRLKPDGSHPFELSWEPGESPPAPPLPAPGLGLPVPGLPAPAMPPPPLPFATLIKPANPIAAPASAAAPPDLPESFWRWLLVGDLPEEQSA